MGTIWIAVPFREEAADWARDAEIPIPPGTPDGTHPELADLEAALAALPALHVADRSITTDEHCFDLVTRSDRSGPWTVLRAQREPSGRLSLSFHKGWEEAVLEVAQAIAHRCGPLVVVADSEGSPILVTSTDVFRSP